LNNLKSLIISSLFGFPHEQFKSIIESEQFQNFKLFKVKEENIFSARLYSNNTLSDKDYLFKTIFDHQNCLEILTISSFKY